MVNPIRSLGSMSNARRKLIAYAILASGTAWQLHYLSSLDSDGRRIAVAVLIAFDVVYGVGCFFAAGIEAESAGILVDQFGKKHLTFAEVTRCFFVPFFPQSFTVVLTKRAFPLSILFCPTSIDVSSGDEVRSVKLTAFLDAAKESSSAST